MTKTITLTEAEAGVIQVAVYHQWQEACRAVEKGLGNVEQSDCLKAVCLRLSHFCADFITSRS